MSIRRQPDRRRPVINADLRVDEVDLKKVPGLRDVPGRLGMTILPGRKGYGSHGLHDRDLRADAVALRSLGVDRFVLLVEDQELRDCEVPDIVEVLASNDVVVRRFPIVDGFTPSDQAGFAALMDEIEDDLQRGRFVAVTCRAGLGRTGTLVGCLLRQNELDGEAAIALTRASRGGTIEPYQVAFVQGWARQPRDRSSE
jgi:protein-tyrosine phosphatase